MYTYIYIYIYLYIWFFKKSPFSHLQPQARALGFMESYLVSEAEDGHWGHVHFTGPEGYEAGRPSNPGRVVVGWRRNDGQQCGIVWDSVGR